MYIYMCLYVEVYKEKNINLPKISLYKLLKIYYYNL